MYRSAIYLPSEPKKSHRYLFSSTKNIVKSFFIIIIIIILLGNIQLIPTAANVNV